jgi:hypothetical protein
VNYVIGVIIVAAIVALALHRFAPDVLDSAAEKVREIATRLFAKVRR